MADAKPWEKYQKQKPWEKYRGAKTAGEAANASIASAVNAYLGMKPDATDEATRVLSAVNEDWLAPAIGGIPDLLGNAIYAPINELFGTDYRADLTGLLNEGMRDTGMSGGADYRPRTEGGKIAGNVLGAAASTLVPMGAAQGLAAKVAPGVTQQVLNVLGSNVGSQVAGGAGAGLGSYAADKIAPDSLAAKIAGLLAGGFLGGGAYSLATQGAPVPQAIQAFERQNVPYTGALSTGEKGIGNRLVRGAENTIFGSSFGGGQVIDDAQRTAMNAARSRLDDIAAATGNVKTADEIGQMVRGSVDRFIGERATIGNAFDEVANALARMRLSACQIPCRQWMNWGAHRRATTPWPG